MGIYDVTQHRPRGWGGSQYSDSSKNTFSSSRSFSTQQSDDLDEEMRYKLPSDMEMLQRAREVHMDVDFDALSAGPEKGGPWQRVEVADHFAVFKRPATAVIKDNHLPGLEVMCAGQLEACLEEVASVLRSNSEADHTSAMEGLFSKKFIFGSLDREVSCSEETQNHDDDDHDSNEQLTVKTTSFLRTSMFGHNEQWCFSDFFQRKEEGEGFTISQYALPPLEPTPGRVVGENARVDQLHGLNASYVVDQLPEQKGLRVVYNAWFEEIVCIESSISSSMSSSSSSCRPQNGGLGLLSSSSLKKIDISAASRDKILSRRRSSGKNVDSIADGSLGEIADGKAQLRRLLLLAHGIAKLPNLVQRRRFGIQVPADFDTVQVANTRCPCCTHSLTPVKMSLSLAASAFSKRSLRSLKTDTRRCYLCGYLVCINCWSAECMESTVGRVVEIVVCTRCHASVKACDYSEVYASGQENNRGPVKVVEDQNNTSPAPMLTDFLTSSLMNSSVSGDDRAAVLSVVRMMLQHNESTESENDRSSYSESDCSSDEGFSDQQNDNVPVVELKKFLNDEDQLPQLESCVFANAERRSYPMTFPDDPATMVPPTIYPGQEKTRLQLVNDKGLMLLAHQLAPLETPDSFDNVCDVSDLDLLCQLAVRASGCPNTFLSIMGTEHLHILSSSNPAFLHSTMPREHTVCQHTIMTLKPFMVCHPEADVRFHELGAIKALSTRCYMGFPLTVPVIDNYGGFETEMSVGTLCCVTPTARSELTRSQYTALKRIADTASRLILLKGQKLQQQQSLGTAVTT